jgi:SAM-dependent methyltransferase
VLTVDFDRLPVGPGDRVLDMGCGAGRHAFAAYRAGADVVALDRSASDLAEVEATFAAMRAAGEVPLRASATAVRGDAYALPFPDATFDRVIAAEVLEHLPEDDRAVAELARVLRPGGLMAVTVPRWGPERVCWALSDAYHQVEGGHVRIYRGGELVRRLETTGLVATGQAHTHGLHAPYWWLKCAVGVTNDANPLVRAYHRLLVWDLMKKPWPTRLADRVLDPVVGKSLVVYLRKPEAARAAA